MDLTPEQRSQYATIIDKILRGSDLNTISAKAIRKGLSEKLGYDVSHQKAAISDIIMERFDNISKTTPPTSSDDVLKNTVTPVNGNSKHELKNGKKRSSTPSSSGAPTPESDESDVDISPPKKKRKQPDSDAKLAAKLQAEENSRARPSRAGANKKAISIRKKSTPKKKSSTKIKVDDDSDLDLNSDGEKKDVVRKGGFHKQYSLSPPLATLVGENQARERIVIHFRQANSTQLSRPQVVKKIWAHIHAMNLQDPNDKRQILCDDKMYAVFKQDKVHMFTMNKLLGKQLYPVEDLHE